MYIDTSALAAYYMPEPQSDFVQEMIQSAGQVHISLLGDLELLSAFRKKEHLKEIDRDLAEEARKLFKNHLNRGYYNVMKVTPFVFNSAEFILDTTSTPLRTLDALHLGLVYEYKLKLFTFDSVLLEAAKAYNIRTVSID